MALTVDLQLRTRIAVTFLVLLATVLAIALAAVSRANHGNAERELQHQLDVGRSAFEHALEANRRQLTLAAEVVAADAGFREAVALKDDATMASVLENSGQRIKADMVVLTRLDGTVMAATGSRAIPGRPFPASNLFTRRLDPDGNILPNTTVASEDGRIYQLVAVVVRSPLPVAWVIMGFELDRRAADELARMTGLAVTLSISSGAQWTETVSTAPPAELQRTDLKTRRLILSDRPGAMVRATLSKSLADAMLPFERLTNFLYLTAAFSLLSSGYAAFWLARNITRPLRTLTDAVDQIRAGRYDIQVSMPRRDELGMLAEGLQLMQTAVQSRDRSIRKMAFEDALTGLMNRVAFSTALDEALAAEVDPIGVAVINVHRFRHINEHLGYPIGDAVLRKIASRLTAAPVSTAAVARLAADQFAAFTVLTGHEHLRDWGARLALRLSDAIVVEGQSIDVTATVGLAAAPVDAQGADELLRCAELALANARREKRPSAEYAPALKPAARDQLSLLGELRRAVDRDELCMFFQPKLRLADGLVAGAEVLIRWRHPSRGLLGPGAFISFAEKTGFIRRITRWTLEHAIAQGAHWHRAGAALPLSINVTVDDINDAQFHLHVAAALRRHRLPPALLTLEVTESGFMDDMARALLMLEALAALGVKLSIDDFGTGYSSLSHLARMPVHEMKIDRSFVLGLETDPHFSAIVKSAIDMGHALGLEIVAEGIETEAAAMRLRDLHCDVAQGYLYAKPMPLGDLETWLEGRVRVPFRAAPANLPVVDFNETAAAVLR